MDRLETTCRAIATAAEPEHFHDEGVDWEWWRQEGQAVIARTTTRPDAALVWCAEIFGPVARQTDERACRLLEEALELSQAAGLPAEIVSKIMQRVYSRPAGHLRMEVGQAALTLELFAANVGLSADIEADREFARVRAIPKEEWTRRHDAKVLLGIARPSTKGDSALSPHTEK